MQCGINCFGLALTNYPSLSRMRCCLRLNIGDIRTYVGVLKVLLNALVTEQMPVEKASQKMIRLVCDSRVDDAALGLTNEPGVDTFLMRLSRKDHCDELFDHLNRLRESAKSQAAQQAAVDKAQLD
jgi:hypothetical protein